MDERLNRKYQRVLEILPDVAACAKGRLVLVGGTALTLFYLNHRISVDLDFVPVNGEDVRLKEELKGCLTKNNYRTSKAAYKNQFVIQFADTSVKIEVFRAESKINKIDEYTYHGTQIKVASLDDLLHMKTAAYEKRKAARDLFDVFCISRYKIKDGSLVPKLISSSGPPENLGEIIDTAFNNEDIKEFERSIKNAASKTGN